VAKLLRFAVVGVANTSIDILALNLLLWMFPTTALWEILLLNSLACVVAACNSFFWNKYWTFQYREQVTARLVARFAGISLFSLIGNNLILWLCLQMFPGVMSGVGLGTIVLKVLVGAVMMAFSFAGQLLWVFVGSRSRARARLSTRARPALVRFPLSLSVVLPAYNEEAVIASTVEQALRALEGLVEDFEILVVNDGSSDRTGEIVAALAACDARIRLITHPVNQGAGAALVSGFVQASGTYTFYMDSDGQFDIADLGWCLPYLGTYDGVFGYRLDRQDSWMRRLNAWGWNRLVRVVFNMQVRDIDCAFKIFRTAYFRQVVLEARGALLLTEVVYKFLRAGYRYTQVPVRHLPREAGQATGARLSVIARAFQELFFYARKWHREEQQAVLAASVRETASRIAEQLEEVEGDPHFPARHPGPGQT
jgi:glycosyltransferase involved in cell wall biosynthesis/putative flippase GtrA